MLLRPGRRLMLLQRQRQPPAALQLTLLLQPVLGSWDGWRLA